MTAAAADDTTAPSPLEDDDNEQTQNRNTDDSANGAENDDSVGDGVAPRFRVGLIADIQHAPIPDGYSYSGVPRYYRHALDAARHAARHFQEERVDFVVNLGDIVDGKCQNVERHGGDPFPPHVDDPGTKVVDDVVDALSAYKNGPVLHAYGNHCLYNLDRQTLQQKLGIPFVEEPCGDLVGYSCFPYGGFHFVTIDSYDIAIMRRCEKNSVKHKAAVEILSKNNPNYPSAENSPEGLEGVEMRFVAFNGAVGQIQLEWLRSTLERVRALNEKAVIISHQPILPGSSSPVCLIWNYEEVLDVLREYDDVVVASWSGHAHKGGYKRDDRSGIHFRVFEAALENNDPHKTYSIIDVYDDRMEVRGFGNCLSAVYKYGAQRRAVMQ